MALSNTTRKTGPLPTDGATTTFNFGFKLADDDHIKVIYTDSLDVETELTRVDSSPGANQYTVSGVGVDAGGSITTGSTYASGGSITMIRDLDFTQPRAYTNQRGYRGETHEDSLDELTMMIQQLQEQLDRVVIVPISDTTSLVLPSATERASKLLGFNASGEFVSLSELPESAVVISSFAETVLDDANAAAMFDTLVANATAATLRSKLLIEDGMATVKHNLSATTDPTTGDDSGDSYAVGSVWINVTGDKAWVCLDATLAAAVWRRIDSPLTTRGDVLRRGASEVERLALGSAGQLLGSNGTDVGYIDGGWVYDSGNSVTVVDPEANVTIDFVSGYDYFIELANVNASGTADQLVGYLTVASVIQSGSTDYGPVVDEIENQTSDGRTTRDGELRLTSYTRNIGLTGLGLHGTIEVRNARNSSLATTIKVSTIAEANGGTGAMCGMVGSFMRMNAEDNDSLVMQLLAGTPGTPTYNLDSGSQFKVYRRLQT